MTAGARAGGGTGPGLFGLFVVFCAVVVTTLAIVPLDQINNHDHANERHIEAPAIRRMHRKGLCHETEAYVSTRRGTLLVLCKLDDKPHHAAEWGGLIWRVLEYRHGKHVLLGDETMYECTVLAHDRAYWDRVIVRDGYVKAADTRWFSALGWLIAP